MKRTSSFSVIISPRIRRNPPRLATKSSTDLKLARPTWLKSSLERLAISSDRSRASSLRRRTLSNSAIAFSAVSATPLRTSIILPPSSDPSHVCALGILPALAAMSAYRSAYGDSFWIRSSTSLHSAIAFTTDLLPTWNNNESRSPLSGSKPG